MICPAGPGPARRVSPGPADSRPQAGRYRAAAHRRRRGRLARPERGEFAEPPQQPSLLDEVQQFPQPAPGAAALRRRDDAAAQHVPELVPARDEYDVASSRTTTLVNRSTPNVLSPSRSIGVAMSQLTANLQPGSPVSVRHPLRLMVT